jgi:hypothetical protein
MKIHIHSREGLYNVDFYTNAELHLSTAKYQFRVPASDFKGLAGGLWNFNLSQEETNAFYETINPGYLDALDAGLNQILELMQGIDPKTNNEYLGEQEDPNYRVMFEDAAKELSASKKNEFDLIKLIYSDLSKIDLDQLNFDENGGIKFIIQESMDECSYRLKFDPHRFKDNMHSTLSFLFMENGWGTISGGWLKIIGRTVYLYGKSGDYGVFEGKVAKKAFEVLYPKYTVVSIPSATWPMVVGISMLGKN